MFGTRVSDKLEPISTADVVQFHRSTRASSDRLCYDLPSKSNVTDGLSSRLLEVLVLKALYYPHTEIHSPVIVRNALLLWDRIETIIPNSPRPTPGFRGTKNAPSRMPGDRWFREAVDLVVENRVPTDLERREAHGTLLDLVQSGFLTKLVQDSPAKWRNHDYLIYPDKFLDETWKVLAQHGMARWVQAEADYGVPSAAGFLMMSILADVCAGTQIQKVTDRNDAYGWMAEYRAKILGSQYVTNLDISQVAPAHDRLVSLSVEALDGRRVPLRKLVEFRKRELRTGGSDYAAMRRRYAKAVQSHLDRLGKEARTASDVRELDRQFKDELKQDIAELKKELDVVSVKTLFSREVALSTLILAGTLLSPIAGLTALATNVGGIGVIPLMKAAVDYRTSRREVLQKHAMSWLFLTTQGRLTIR
jgi:hypothetical protein